MSRLKSPPALINLYCEYLDQHAVVTRQKSEASLKRLQKVGIAIAACPSTSMADMAIKFLVAGYDEETKGDPIRESLAHDAKRLMVYLSEGAT